MSTITLQDIRDNIMSMVQKGESRAKAVATEEKRIIRAYKDENRDMLACAAIHISLAGADKSIPTGERKSRILKIIHKVADAMDENREHYSNYMSALAAVPGVMRKRENGAIKEYVWNSKVLHAHTVTVFMGDKTDMSLPLKDRAKEYKGFDGTDLVHYLMSRDKDYWVTTASRAIMKEIASIIEGLEGNKAIGKKFERTDWGTLSYKTIWRVVGDCARAAYDQEHGFSQARLDNLQRQIRYRDNSANDNAIAGDSYLIQLEKEAEELERELAYKEELAAAYTEMAEFIKDFNKVNKWADPRYTFDSESGETKELPPVELPTKESQERARLEYVKRSTQEQLDRIFTAELDRLIAGTEISAGRAKEAFASLIH